jgi:hypothetical protein
VPLVHKDLEDLEDHKVQRVLLDLRDLEVVKDLEVIQVLLELPVPFIH